MSHRFVLLACLLSPLVTAGEADRQRLDLSGFARVVAGSINDDDVAFEGYDDGMTLSEQSLFALQADLRLGERLSIAAQGLLHSSGFRDSGLEWLYLNYEPSANWQFKLGRLRTPFLNYSDVIDVGYAYPWISAPAPVYGSYLFSNYEGASGTLHTRLGAALLDVEVYWGSDDTEVYNAGLEIPTEIEDLRGAIATLEYGNLSARIGYHEAGSVTASVPELVQFADLLRQEGFSASADSLSLRGGVDALQAGLRYDDLDYFVIAEFLRIEADVVTAAPRIDSYYLTLGRNLYPLQLHATAGRSRSDQPQPVTDEIPGGVSPLFDFLAAGYQQIFDSSTTDNIDYLSAGLRWDLRADMAFKAELSWVEERRPSQFFEVESGGDFDGSTLLFQLGLEWVF